MATFGEYFQDERGKGRVEALDLKGGYSVKAECLPLNAFYGENSDVDKWSVMLLSYDGSIIAGPAVYFDKKEAEKCVKHCADLVEADKVEEAVECLEALRVIHQVPPKKKETKEDKIEEPEEIKMDMKVNKFKDLKISAPSKNKYTK